MPRNSRYVFAPLVLATGLFLCLVVEARADVVVLKNRNRLEGTITKETGDGVTVKMAGGAVTIPLEDIEKIERRPVDPAAIGAKDSLFVQIARTLGIPPDRVRQLSTLFKKRKLPPGVRGSLYPEGIPPEERGAFRQGLIAEAVAGVKQAFTSDLKKWLLFPFRILLLALYIGFFAKIFAKLTRGFVSFRQAFLFYLKYSLLALLTIISIGVVLPMAIFIAFLPRLKFVWPIVVLCIALNLIAIFWFFLIKARRDLAFGRLKATCFFLIHVILYVPFWMAMNKVSSLLSSYLPL